MNYRVSYSETQECINTTFETYNILSLISIGQSEGISIILTGTTLPKDFKVI